jgi:hypothetical protein
MHDIVKLTCQVGANIVEKYPMKNAYYCVYYYADFNRDFFYWSGRKPFPKPLQNTASDYYRSISYAFKHALLRAAGLGAVNADWRTRPSVTNLWHNFVDDVNTRVTPKDRCLLMGATDPGSFSGELKVTTGCDGASDTTRW